MDQSSKYSINTLCVQGGYTPGNGEPRQIPIVQSTTFKYDSSDDMGKLFDLQASGYFYSRLQNPTCDTVVAKLTELEGPVPARQPTALPCSTSATRSTTSFLPAPFTAAPST